MCIYSKYRAFLTKPQTSRIAKPQLPFSAWKVLGLEAQFLASPPNWKTMTPPPRSLRNTLYICKHIYIYIYI